MNHAPAFNLNQFPHFPGHILLPNLIHKEDTSVTEADSNAKKYRNSLISILRKGKLSDTERHQLNALNEWLAKVRAWGIKARRSTAKGIYKESLNKYEIGHKGEAICTRYLTETREIQDAINEKFLKNAEIIDEDGNAYKLPQTDAAHRRFCSYYAQSKGIEKLEEEAGNEAIFITITLDSKFHANPKNGGKKWDGSTPEDGLNHFKRLWETMGKSRIYRRVAPSSTIKIIEAHQDGTPHAHILMFCPASDKEALKSAIYATFGNGTSCLIKDIIKAAPRAGKVASPISYLTKYLLKATGNNFGGTDNPANKNRAWRDIYAIRGVTFSGKKIYGTKTAWNECPRPRTGTPNEITGLNKAAQQLFDLAQGAGNNKHDYAGFVTHLNTLKSYNAFSFIREVKQAYFDTNKSRSKIVGMMVSGQEILTRNKHFMLTPPRATEDEKRNEIKEGGVTHSYPREAGAGALIHAYTRVGSKNTALNNYKTQIPQNAYPELQRPTWQREPEHYNNNPKTLSRGFKTLPTRPKPPTRKELIKALTVYAGDKQQNQNPGTGKEVWEGQKAKPWIKILTTKSRDHEQKTSPDFPKTFPSFPRFFLEGSSGR